MTVPPDRGLVTKRCECGHGADAHAMNMATHQCSGRCLRGHYAPNGNYQGGGCDCPKFKKATADGRG